MKDMSKKITMRCNICANDHFLVVNSNIKDLLSAPDDTLIKCSDCGRTITKEQLILENRHIIDANIEDFKKEIIKELQKEFNKKFR